MIRLTALHYKIKVESLERLHNIQEYNNGLLFEWEQAEQKAKSVDLEYPTKPFIEPFEFKDEDYDITEVDILIRKDDIYSCKVNTDGYTEILTGNGSEYTLKESLVEIEKLFRETCETE